VIISTTDTRGFIALAMDAEGRNRSIHLEHLVPHIDTEGVHLCAFRFPHNDVEWRTQWFVKVAEDTPGSREFAPDIYGLDVWLDVSFEAWEQHVSTTQQH